MAPNDGEPIFMWPHWLLESWAEQGVPIDEFGRPDYAAMERIGTEQRAAAESIKARTEESQSPDLTVAIRAGSRFH
jgi:hypothetical protein